MPEQYSERYFDSADGLRLFFRDYSTPAGDGRVPVMCLPGLTRNSRDFERLALSLVHSCRVICPDLRGRGKSAYDPNWRNYNPARYAEDMLLLLGQLEIERVRLVGTSLGGMISMLLADAAPALVAAVVLNDIGPEIDPTGLVRIVAATGNLAPAVSFEDAIEKTRAYYQLALPDWSEANWRWYAQSTYRPIGNGAFDLNYDRNIGEAVRAGAATLPRDPWDIFNALANIPTLLVRGELSDIMSAQIAAKMCAVKPDLRVVTVSNRGHAPILDEAEARHALVDFLAAD